MIWLQPVVGVESNKSKSNFHRIFQIIFDFSIKSNPKFLNWIEQISNEFQFDYSHNSSFDLIINSTPWWNPWGPFCIHVLQSDPNQNFWFQMAVALKLCILLYVHIRTTRRSWVTSCLKNTTTKLFHFQMLEFCFMYHNFNKQWHTFIAYPERNIWPSPWFIYLCAT